MDGLYALEWSKRQQSFHIQPLADAVRKNLDAFAADRRIDYLPIHIGSHAICQAVADQLRPIMLRRAQVAA